MAVIGPIGVTLSQAEFVRTEADGSLFITTEELPKYIWFWLAVRHHQPRRDAEEHVELVDSCLVLANKVLNSLTTALSTGSPQAEGVPVSSIVEPSTAGKVLLSLVILGDQLCLARNEIIRYSDGPALHWDYPSFGTALLQEAGWYITNVENVPSYVAISHVWSDGKGNPHQNFLPACQLQRLQDSANALYPSSRQPVPFWMDTLCVPVGKDFRPARNRAINRMKATYKNAEKILVFDSSLELVHSTIAPEEAVIRLRYSPWSTRLWTMQEGRLGLKVYLQFRDKSKSFDDQPYQNGASGNLHVVDKILKSMTTQDLASSAPAVLLVRALAYTDQTFQLRLSYAQKPPQSNSEEEELRVSAIESFEDLKFEDNLHKTWLPIAKDLIGETYEPSWLDDQLRSNIHSIMMSPVVFHCGEAWLRIRGFSYHTALNRESGTDHLRSGFKPSSVFDDTARGLQGRTTSRIEDEPVCLCALLGIDTTPVLDIPVLSSRNKRILSSISSKPKFATACCKVGFNPQSRLNRCHDERMKAAWLLLDAFPPHMIFWNVPRLQEKGWRWAPSTFLSENTQISSWATVMTRRLDEGLLVGFEGWRISLKKHEIMQTSAEGDSDCVILQIDCPDLVDNDYHPFRRSWMRSRLLGPSKRWRKILSKHHDVALIVEHGRRGESRGVLASVHKEADGIIFTTFQGAAERYLSTSPLQSATTVFSGTGRWIDGPKWCVG
ncbi:MAG: hypothetical protein Q9195_008268 [Heterodermia aff. obscurata]